MSAARRRTPRHAPRTNDQPAHHWIGVANTSAIPFCTGSGIRESGGSIPNMPSTTTGPASAAATWKRRRSAASSARRSRCSASSATALDTGRAP